MGSSVLIVTPDHRKAVLHYLPQFTSLPDIYPYENGLVRTLRSILVSFTRQSSVHFLAN